MKRFPFAIFAILFIFDQLSVLVNSQIEESPIPEGTYIISSAVKGRDNTDYSLYAQGRLPSKKLGDVTLQKYAEGSAPFHWTVKKKGGWLFNLTPASGPKNTISESEERSGASEYSFVAVGSTTYRIELIVGRAAPRCLKSNGLDQPVSFSSCGSRDDARDYSLLWEFKVANNGGRRRF